MSVNHARKNVAALRIYFFAHIPQYGLRHGHLADMSDNALTKNYIALENFAFIDYYSAMDKSRHGSLFFWCGVFAEETVPLETNHAENGFSEYSATHFACT